MRCEFFMSCLCEAWFTLLVFSLFSDQASWQQHIKKDSHRETEVKEKPDCESGTGTRCAGLPAIRCPNSVPDHMSISLFHCFPCSSHRTHVSMLAVHWVNRKYVTRRPTRNSVRSVRSSCLFIENFPNGPVTLFLLFIVDAGPREMFLNEETGKERVKRCLVCGVERYLLNSRP